MYKYPAEIFGLPSSNVDAILASMKQDRYCPFMDQQCTKTNGICSVYSQEQTVAICPNRFLESNKVFKKIADDYFGSENNLLVFNEVYSGNRALGSFDFVIVKHRPLSNAIVDFVVVEFQTVDTTMTGELNRALADFQAGIDVTQGNYKFGLNWANVWKRCFIQILNKGRVLEQWGNKAYWVAQEPAYQHFVDSYGLAGGLHQGDTGTTVFDIYDLVSVDSDITLQHSRTQSTSIPQLLAAFSNNPDVPSKDQFIDRLQTKSRQNLTVRLTFDE